MDFEVDILTLDSALGELERLDCGQGRIVELRFFGGLTVEETAEVLGVRPRPSNASGPWPRARCIGPSPAGRHDPIVMTATGGNERRRSRARPRRARSRNDRRMSRARAQTMRRCANDVLSLVAAMATAEHRFETPVTLSRERRPRPRQPGRAARWTVQILYRGSVAGEWARSTRHVIHGSTGSWRSRSSRRGRRQIRFPATG